MPALVSRKYPMRRWASDKHSTWRRRLPLPEAACATSREDRQLLALAESQAGQWSCKDCFLRNLSLSNLHPEEHGFLMPPFASLYALLTSLMLIFELRTRSRCSDLDREELRRYRPRSDLIFLGDIGGTLEPRVDCGSHRFPTSRLKIEPWSLDDRRLGKSAAVQSRPTNPKGSYMPTVRRSSFFYKESLWTGLGSWNPVSLLNFQSIPPESLKPHHRVAGALRSEPGFSAPAKPGFCSGAREQKSNCRSGAVSQRCGRILRRFESEQELSRTNKEK